MSTRATLVITSYNRAHLLQRAIRSALGAAEGVKVVVVDDASADGSVAVARQFPEVALIRNPQNLGVARSLNRGCEEASGDYIAFLADDDERIEGSLGAQLDALEREPRAALAYAQAIPMGRDGEPMARPWPSHCESGDLFLELLAWNRIPAPTVVVRRGALKEVGGFDPSMTGSEDWHLWIRLAHGHRVVGQGVAVCRYTMPHAESGQISSARSRQAFSMDRVQRDCMGLPRARSLPGRVRRRVRRTFLNRLSDFTIDEAVQSAARGHHAEARNAFLAACWLNPKRAVRPITLRRLLLAALRVQTLGASGTSQSRAR